MGLDISGFRFFAKSIFQKWNILEVVDAGQREILDPAAS